MPTAACGINCDVCRLNLQGVCTTCGPGKSDEGARKLAAQERILGRTCPILECAVKKRIAYCPRDCEHFPCLEFRSGPYPYSQGFLNMQERRRGETPPAKAPSGNVVTVPEEYWADLEKRDSGELCGRTLAKAYPSEGYLLPFLKEYLLIDQKNRRLKRQTHGGWEAFAHPLLELLCLVYLLNAGPEQLQGEMVSAHELKTRHFFTGPHELKTRPLLTRYGHDLDGFKKAAAALGGEEIGMADAAYKFIAFPKVPLFYLLWGGDEEFPPSLSILFDRSIERHLAADAIWGLVNLVSDMLLVDG